MNYLESIAYLESLSPTLEKPTVERITLFLKVNDNPHKEFSSFHIAGTNGKGSTAAILDSVLRACGLKVGRFTGPHLLRWNERFHIDGKPISDDQFAKYATTLRELSESFAEAHPEIGKLTWFEFITCLAFLYFRDQRINVAVLEVGLGGRFDATNVLGDSLLCSIITNISLDHTHILGATEELIAFEKAGIIVPGKAVVTAALGPALDVIKDRAHQLRSPLVCIDGNGEVTLLENDASAVSLSGLQEARKLTDIDHMHGPLLGAHQRTNALLAFVALYITEAGLFGASPLFPKKNPEGPLLSNPAPDGKNEAQSAMTDAPVLISAWRSGVQAVFWPGRMQRVGDRVVLDGAHNPGGAKALRSALNECFGNRRAIFVLSCFDNKDAGGILQQLFRPGDRVFLCEAATRRATFPKAKLLQMARDMKAEPEIFDSIGAAFDAALQAASAEQVVVATGSFATVRECMQKIGWESVEDGRAKSGKIDSAETVHS